MLFILPVATQLSVNDECKMMYERVVRVVKER